MMNEQQVQSHIKYQKEKIKGWQKEWQAAFDAGSSEQILKGHDQKIKTIESSLSDFMDVLDNG